MIELICIPFLPGIVLLLLRIERRLTKVETKLAFLGDCEYAKIIEKTAIKEVHKP